MPGPRRITSRQHPLVRRCRALARRRGETEILLEGEHLISDALAAGVSVATILALPARAPELVARARAAGADIYEASQAVIESASPVRDPSGILAIATWAPVPVDRLLQESAGPLLALVDVQDPGNLGSAIRAADALGAGGVLALDATADPGSWKALRGAMGSTFRIPVTRGRSADAMAAAQARGWTIAATLPTGGARPDTLASGQRVLILLGNEGSGLSAELLLHAGVRLSIPMRTGVESLNVAVCAALLLDGMRQNRHSAASGTAVD